MENHKEQFEEIIRRASAMFFERESNRDALLSVTRVLMSNDRKYAHILISVLPEDKEESVLRFTKRQRPALREYLKKTIRSRTIPFIEIEIDVGEKNRQRLDNIVG